MNRRAIALMVALAAVAPGGAQEHDSSRAQSGSGGTVGLPATRALGSAPEPTATRIAAVAVKQAIAEDPLLRRTLRGLAPAAPGVRFILVNLNGRRLWYLDGDTIRFAAPVGVGRETPRDPADRGGRHATPRTRFTVLRKDALPMWVPPNWYFEEVAAITGRSLRYLGRRDTIRARDGNAAYYFDGGELVRRGASGQVERVAVADSAGMRLELVVDGTIVVPPVGATQRQYPHVLGPRRLAFREGYAIHGTDDPESVGRATSHGCLRLRNEDMVTLFDLVAVGTPVFLR